MDDREPSNSSLDPADESLSHSFAGSELEAALGQRMQDCIQHGNFPLEVQFAMDFFAQAGGLRCRTRLLPSDPPAWPEPVISVEAGYRLPYEHFQQAVIQRIVRNVRGQQAALLNLVSLAQIDRNRCCELAAEHFAQRLESPESVLPDAQLLPLFVLLLHDVGPVLPADLVTHSRIVSRQAADRLRAKLLEALEAPQCVDDLGLLAAQTLRDRLEKA